MPESTDNDVIQGVLKLIGKVDCECFTSWADFIAKFPKLFAVEIPSDITNVIVSVNNPDDDQHDCIWFRLSTSGSFLGIFVYATGDWRQIFPSPKAIIRMYGDSRSIPDGYMLIDSSNPHFTAAQQAHIQTGWYLSGDGLAWAIFDVTYEGF